MFLFGWGGGVQLGYGLDSPWFESHKEQEIFLFSKRRDWSMGANPASYLVRTMVFFPGVEQPRREVNLSPQSSADAKNEVYLLLPPFVPSRQGKRKLYLLHILDGICFSDQLVQGRGPQATYQWPVNLFMFAVQRMWLRE